MRENRSVFKKLAFFCTQGGSGDKKAFAEMEAEGGVKPLATLTLLSKEVVQGGAEEKVAEFVKQMVID